MSENGNGSAIRAALDRLSHKQRAFVILFTGECKGNRSRSARLAGYGHEESKDDYFRVKGSTLLTNSNVARAVDLLYEAQGMTENAVKAGLADQARGRIDLFLGDDNQIDPNALRKYGHLVKSITPTKYGMKLELYNAQRAYELVGRHLGMFKDRLDVTSGDERIGLSESEHVRALAGLVEAIGEILPRGDS